MDADVDGLSRVITDRDTRLINGCGPPPENVRSLGRNVRWRGHSSDDSLSVRSVVGVSHYLLLIINYNINYNNIIIVIKTNNKNNKL